MILWEQRDKLQALAVIALAILAFRRGAAPERWSSAVLAAMTAAVWVYQISKPSILAGAVLGYGSVHPYFLTVDALALMALVVIALKANRFYPIVLAGCQLVSVMTHVASGILRSAFPLAYALFNILPFYFMIAVLALGLVAHVRREGRVGRYLSWRGSSAPSSATTLRPPTPPTG